MSNKQTRYLLNGTTAFDLGSLRSSWERPSPDIPNSRATSHLPSALQLHCCHPVPRHQNLLTGLNPEPVLLASCGVRPRVILTAEEMHACLGLSLTDLGGSTPD